eukprot:TRINITY_DN6651_c0_g2_i1.p1 TRINITY_DN6651_c0_g2~~TRINITY_DN6651_c0_g2_i1.p1  ORF type:complete len:1159 (+),score=342.64 TRINITY_DN6651_c0_g2_i1:203-3679(+)
MSKLAERSRILLDVGEGLLKRMYNAKARLKSAKDGPEILRRPEFKRVADALTRRFPDLPTDLEKVQGNEILQAEGQKIYEQLEDYYLLFNDMLEWRGVADLLFTELAQNVVNFKLGDNSRITYNFMEMVTTYVRMHFYLEKITDRKNIVATYAKVYQNIKGSTEPSFQKLGQYIVEYDHPLRRLQADFKPISNTLGSTLICLKEDFAKMLDVATLRKDGVLSVIHTPAYMSVPVQSLLVCELSMCDRIHDWIMFTFLLCPEEFAIPSTIPMLKQGLSHGWAVPIIRNESYYVHDDYSKMFDSHKSANKLLTKTMRKEVKGIKETLVQAVGGMGPKSHGLRRTFVRQEMQVILNLVEDYPGLVAPKTQLILSLLSLARQEIFWYFRHKTTPAPKAAAKHYREEDYSDSRITELIALTQSLAGLMRKYKRVVQAYYIEYLEGTDFEVLSEVVKRVKAEKSPGTKIEALLDSILHDVSLASTQSFMEDGQVPDFRGMRMNMERAEVAMSLSHSTVSLASDRDLSDRLSHVYQHSLFVDSLDTQLSNCSSLRELWFFRDAVAAEARKCFSNVDTFQPEYATAYLTLYNEMPWAATTFAPEQKDIIGKEAVKMARQFVEMITTNLADALDKIAATNIKLHAQIETPNAGNVALQDKNVRLDKNVIVLESARESQFQNREQLKFVRADHLKVQALAAAVASTPRVVVYDHQFSLAQFLHEELASRLHKFINRISVQTPLDKEWSIQIQRPSIILAQVNVYISTMLSVEEFVDVNVPDLVRQVLLNNSYNKALDGGPLDWASIKEINLDQDTLIGKLAAWYSEFVNKIAACQFIHSPNRRCFYSAAPHANLHVQEYTKHDELVALCQLVGPAGVRLIDRNILKFVARNVAALKDLIGSNKATLELLGKCYTKEAATNSKIRELKSLDGFMNRSVSIGNALNFRKLLHQALGDVMGAKTGHLRNAVGTFFNQYLRNTFLTPEYIPLDVLAGDCGIDVSVADQPLKSYINSVSTSADLVLWSLLPHMFAAGFTSTVWQNASYNTALEAYNNNAHSLATCISTLITALVATSADDNTTEQEIVTLLTKFIEMSSFILMRMACMPAKEIASKHRIHNISSVMIFLDIFIEESPLLSRDVLEGYMPYTLLRSMYKDVYHKGDTTDALLGD